MHKLWFYAKYAYYNLVKSVPMERMLIIAKLNQLVFQCSSIVK